MKNNIFWQKLKILTFPFNSYYSYRNPDKKLSDYDEEVIFNDLKNRTTKLDTIKLLKDSIYKSTDLPEEWLFKKNNELANYFLMIKDNKFYINEHKDKKDKNLFETFTIEGDERKILSWVFLKGLINKDILKTAYIYDNIDIDGKELSIANKSVFTTDLLLERILQEGISETHMHTGAGRNFSYFWIDLMNTKDPKMETTLNKMHIDTYEGRIGLKNYILTARLIRIILAYYVNEERTEKFAEMVNDEFEEFSEIIKKFHNGKALNKDNELDGNLENYVEMAKMKLDLRVIDINFLENIENIDMGDNNADDFYQKIIKSDIIAQLFNEDFPYDECEKKFVNKCGDKIEFYLPEHVLLYKCLSQIKKELPDTKKHPKSDSNDADGKIINCFARIFWQYIRIKNIIHKYIIQQYDSGKGLDVFSQIYERHSKLDCSDSTSEVFHSHFVDQRMKKMEIRITPQDKEGLKRKLRKILFEYGRLLNKKYFKANNFPLIGIIYHFIKRKKTDEDIDPCYFLYCIREDMKFLHNGKLKETYLEQAQAICEVIKEIPELANYIVGIDAASKENDTEPCYFKEVYKTIRDWDYIYDGKCSEGHLPDTLGFTYHVGEEFRDIISGLRHVNEVIEHFGFMPGDRIGHGIVIGIDIDKWSDLNPVVYLPAHEYLDNLLWEWGLYNNDENLKNCENISYLENNILKVAEIIFGFVDGITARDLYNCYLSKFDPGLLIPCSNNPGSIPYEEKKSDSGVVSNEVYCNSCISSHTQKKWKLKNEPKFVNSEVRWNSENIKYAFHCEYFRDNIEQTVSIEITRNKIEKYIRLQEYMKGKLNKKGIIIEVNPSSNLLIGDFYSYKDYHIENLSSPKDEKVIITINTDDPITFNTNLSNEYALIFDLMLKKEKYTRKEIIEWLDRIRQNGNRYSFIKDRGLNKFEVIREIKQILKKLEN